MSVILIKKPAKVINPSKHTFFRHSRIYNCFLFFWIPCLDFHKSVRVFPECRPFSYDCLFLLSSSRNRSDEGALLPSGIRPRRGQGREDDPHLRLRLRRTRARRLPHRRKQTGFHFRKFKLSFNNSLKRSLLKTFLL
jgi:hypothetical protein